VVRFGSVPGSSGGVVPFFAEQIQKGGSATVTQTDVKRYFMTSPEAVQLVLHAATLAKGREIFVLEMGEQMKVVDMVRNLIRLSGFSAEEIPITFVGVRAGEKLYEELVGSDETMEPAGFRQILSVTPKQKPEVDTLNKQIAELETLAIQGDSSRVIDHLCEIVPTYAPEGIPSGSGLTQLAE
jgi:FlaA1/EpsC-like NDP-sugar epimerase